MISNWKTRIPLTRPLISFNPWNFGDYRQFPVHLVQLCRWATSSHYHFFDWFWLPEIKNHLSSCSTVCAILFNILVVTTTTNGNRNRWCKILTNSVYKLICLCLHHAFSFPKRREYHLNWMVSASRPDLPFPGQEDESGQQGVLLQPQDQEAAVRQSAVQEAVVGGRQDRKSVV